MKTATWAQETWDAYTEGRSGYRGHSDTPVCPYCYAVQVIEDAKYLSVRNPDKQARERWTQWAQMHEEEKQLLEACRCDSKLTAGQAASNAQKSLNSIW